MYNLTGIRKFFQAFFVLVILAGMLFSSVTINQTVYASPTEAPSNSANQLLGSSNTVSLLDKVSIVAAKYVGIIQANTDYWDSVNLLLEFPLFDFDGKVTAYLFSVKNIDGKDNGYLIVSADENPVVLESTRIGSHPYGELLHGEQAIYVGATMYYLKQKQSLFNNYYDIRQQKIVSTSDLKSKGIFKGNFYESSNKASVKINNYVKVIKPSSVPGYSQKLISGVPDFDWYLGCSPTSFANIVQYWDSHNYPNLVSSNTTSNDLIASLASYMGTKSDGSTDWNNRVTGMVNYWKSKNYSVSVTRDSPNYAQHITEMLNNRPDIINVVGDATYGNHDMTGVGYEQYDDGNNTYKYVIVHDTWSSTTTNVYLYLPTLSWNETVRVIPK